MNDLYRSFFQQATDAAFVLHLDTGRIQEVNLAFEALTGRTREEILHRKLTFEDLVLEEDLPLLEERRRRRAAQERYTIRLCHRDGEARHVEVSEATVGSPEAPVRAGLVRDVTRQRRREQQLQGEIQRQRTTTFKAAQASVRIGQVLDKLRRIPELASHMLGASSREQLLKEVVADLAAGHRFSYERVVVFLRGGAVSWRSVQTALTRTPRPCPRGQLKLPSASCMTGRPSRPGSPTSRRSSPSRRPSAR